MQSNISTKGKTEFETRIHLSQCQSTNDELLHLLQDSSRFLPEGFVISTDHQLAGRGQRGAVWESQPGQNLLFSLLVRPRNISLTHAFWLSAAAATGICQALEKTGVPVWVKWPNDLMCDDRKLGGILIENAAAGTQLDRSVIGIGLNVNQLRLPPGACSLGGILKSPQDREVILNSVLESVMKYYQILQAEGWEKIRNLYYRSLYRMASLHTYHLPDGSRFQAILKGITEEGQLLLLTQDGERRFWFKEVAFDRIL